MRVKERVEAHKALSDPARLRLFSLVVESDRPLDITEMAQKMALHPNTIRSHLRRLELAGLVSPEVEERTTRGRPKVLFKPGPEAEDMGHGARNYKLLATILAGFIHAGLPDPATAAELAGRGWGSYLSAPVRPHPGDPVDLQAGADMILRMMDRLGFEPELEETAEGVDVLLHHCPFRDIAARYPDTVCSLHLGILRGALADVRSGAAATKLLPFVTPNLCIATLESERAASSN
ncbi:MAG TPA: helix-turn-helix domain-containing protein [Actinomycetota bacterium]|nr:helix-turn-helix domain-containing protein [Actinomycetota bacterium]